MPPKPLPVPVDLYNNPEAVKNAKKQLLERRRPKFNYYSLLGGR